jgi:hypothetical protein
LAADRSHSLNSRNGELPLQEFERNQHVSDPVAPHALLPASREDAPCPDLSFVFGRKIIEGDNGDSDREGDSEINGRIDHQPREYLPDSFVGEHRTFRGRLPYYPLGHDLHQAALLAVDGHGLSVLAATVLEQRGEVRQQCDSGSERDPDPMT